jgi:hypothetical protein
MKSHSFAVTTIALCVMALALVACSRTGDTDDDSADAAVASSPPAQPAATVAPPRTAAATRPSSGAAKKAPLPTTTQTPAVEAFNNSKKAFMVDLDTSASQCAAIRRSAADAGIKDVQLEGYLKQIDAKITDARTKINNVAPQQGLEALNRASEARSAIGALLEQAEGRLQQLRASSGRRGGG